MIDPLRRPYKPNVSDDEIKENVSKFHERTEIYKLRGIDIMQSRSAIVRYAFPFQGAILEVGTGKGYMTISMARSGYNFISIDLDEEMLRFAALNLAAEQMLPKVSFFIMDASTLAFGDNSFSNIVSVCLFHHLYNASIVLREMDRVLVPGGKMVLADFNREGIKIVDDIHSEEGRLHQNSGITDEHIYKFLEALGYSLKQYAEQGHWMGRPGRASVEIIGSRQEIQTVKVGGKAVTVMRGELALPS